MIPSERLLLTFGELVDETVNETTGLGLSNKLSELCESGKRSAKLERRTRRS